MKKNILSAAFALFVIVVIAAAPSFAATPLVNAQWVRDNLAKHDVVFLDVRGSVGAFRAGHIPGAALTSYGRDNWRLKRDGVPGMLKGAINLPGRWTTVDDGGTFRSTETLRRLYAAAGAPTDGPAITFCNTGHWASLGWFVNSELLGNKKTRMYDGSLADWSRDAANPMEQKFKLQ